MTAENLLADFYYRGIKLELSDGNLRYRAPRGALAPELREAIKTHKDELIALLTPDETLPDVIVIPASLPNDEESISACINAQRVGRAAA